MGEQQAEGHKNWWKCMHDIDNEIRGTIQSELRDLQVFVTGLSLAQVAGQPVSSLLWSAIY